MLEHVDTESLRMKIHSEALLLARMGDTLFKPDVIVPILEDEASKIGVEMIQEGASDKLHKILN